MTLSRAVYEEWYDVLYISTILFKLIIIAFRDRFLKKFPFTLGEIIFHVDEQASFENVNHN